MTAAVAGPKPHHLVVTFAHEIEPGYVVAVDHSPVPHEAATVCGIALTPPVKTDRPRGMPCPGCWR